MGREKTAKSSAKVEGDRIRGRYRICSYMSSEPLRGVKRSQ